MCSVKGIFTHGLKVVDFKAVHCLIRDYTDQL